MTINRVTILRDPNNADYVTVHTDRPSPCPKISQQPLTMSFWTSDGSTHRSFP
jgi:hypothetical protein